MVRKAGLYVMLMTLWWTAPFFCIFLFDYPLSQYLKSYVPFFILLASTVAVSLVLNIADRKFNYWNRFGYWRKYLLLCSTYAVNMGIILAIVITLDSYRLIQYFGGDPEGSIGMFFIPSVIAYFVLGLMLGVIRSIVTGKRKSI